MEIIGVVSPPKSESEAYVAANARIDNREPLKTPYKKEKAA